MFLSEIAVSLLVRLWVEMILSTSLVNIDNGQPPCEAVSWNIPCQHTVLLSNRQPPCEAVSWNAQDRHCSWRWSVSLLVRLWVEIEIWPAVLRCLYRSASLWGCELKYKQSLKLAATCRSASLWGCELKYHRSCFGINCKLSASLWGCELKCRFEFHIWAVDRQPPCEAVSWNSIFLTISIVRPRQPPCEAVSWNTMLSIGKMWAPVSLLVRLWVEILWENYSVN